MSTRCMYALVLQRAPSFRLLLTNLELSSIDPSFCILHDGRTPAGVDFCAAQIGGSGGFMRSEGPLAATPLLRRSLP
jgi:hypothetical protein